MSKKTLKSIDIKLFSGHFCGLTHQYLAKLTAQFNIDNEEKIRWFKKLAIFAAGHLKQPAVLATLTVRHQLLILFLSEFLINMLERSVFIYF